MHASPTQFSGPTNVDLGMVCVPKHLTLYIDVFLHTNRVLNCKAFIGLGSSKI